MYKGKDRNNRVLRATSAGIPRAIIDWVFALPENGRTENYHSRLERFVMFYETGSTNAALMTKAWRAIERAAEFKKKDGDPLVHLFLLIPDRPEKQPFSALFGNRVVDVGEEAIRYKEIRDNAIQVIKFFSPHGPQYRNFLNDCMQTGGEALTYSSSVQSKASNMLTGLRDLEKALSRVNPKAKLLSKQYMAPNFAEQNYIHQFADLNRLLTKPKHAALATIAMANCPKVKVTAEAIRKVWERKADKTI